MKTFITTLSIFLLQGFLYSILAGTNPDLKTLFKEGDFKKLINTYAQERISINIKPVKSVAVSQNSSTPTSASAAQEKGFRCQVFAGIQYENAQKIQAELRQKNLDSVYLVTSAENVHKVQVGDYPDRRAAEQMLAQLWKAGYPNAWVVQTGIFIKKEEHKSAVTTASVEMQPSAAPSIYYAIQIFASSDAQKAKKMQSDISKKLNEPVNVVEKSGFWKVLVGQFKSRSEAESYQQKLHEQGFTDAWITQLEQ